MNEIIKNNIEEEEMVKVMIYIPKKDHMRLKSRLALMNDNVSKWVRRKIKIFLNSSENE